MSGARRRERLSGVFGSGRVRRRVLTLASIMSLVAGLVTIATHPLPARAAVGDINVFAGSGARGYSGDGGPATSAGLNQPNGVVQDTGGNVYIADYGNNVVRKVDPSGTISTYAGNGTAGFSGDGGPAIAAEMNQPNWLGFDAAGDLLIADFGNNAIRAVTPSGTITTVAGNGTAGYTGDGGAAVSATLNEPQAVTGLAGGGFLIGDFGNNVVRKVDPAGKITTIAGNGTAGYAGDGGPATAAELNSPVDAIGDAAGDVFISDCSNGRIRKVDTAGNISTIAGNGTGGFAGDGGPATSAEFSCPEGLVLSAGSLYVGDYGNGAVRKIDPSGTITTIAGQGIGGNLNHFNRLTQVWIGGGNLFFADWWDGRIYVEDIADLLSLADSAPTAVPPGQTFAYTLTVSNPGGAGTATGVTLSDSLPAGVTLVSATPTSGTCTPSGSTVTCALGQLQPGDIVTVTITVTAPNATAQLSNTATVTANETDPAPSDNSATAVTGVNSTDLSVTAAGSASVVEAGSSLTYTLTVQNGGPVPAAATSLTDTLPTGATVQSATASQGSCTPAGGTVTCALGTLAVGATATVVISVATSVTAGGSAVDQATVTSANPDQNPANNTASTSTTLLTFGAETPFAGWYCSSGDGGPAVNACLNQPEGVTEDAAGNVYIADAGNNNVRKVDTSGIISTYAGTGTAGYSGDGGPAASAELNSPDWVSIDAAGDLLIVDTGNNRIRSVSPSGTITTVAGNGLVGQTGNDGKAVSAELFAPQAVTGLAGGGFLISDTGNNAVRRVDATGTITAVAGTGAAGHTGDGGSARTAELNGPNGTAVDAAGDVFIADCGNNVVRKVDPTGTISTVAGTGGRGFSGDGGPATSAEFICPTDVKVWAGNLYVSDYGNGAIRRIDGGGNIATIAGKGVGGSNFFRVDEISIDGLGRLFISSWSDDVWVQALGPNLLTVTDSAPADVAFGQTFAYTLTVGNGGGPGTATGVKLTDPLPSGVTFVSAMSSAGTCGQSGGTVTCALGQLAVGTGTTVAITVTAPTSTSQQLSNTAAVSADQTDPYPTDNTSTVVTTVNGADLSITAAASSNPTPASSVLTYTLAVANAGAAVATGASVSDTLPAGVLFVSASATQGSCSQLSGAVTCGLGTMAVGATATVTIGVIPFGQFATVTDSATVTAATPDPNPANNSVALQTLVSGAIVPSTVGFCCDTQGVAQDSVGNVYLALGGRNAVWKIDTSGRRTSYAGTGTAGYSGDGGPAAAAELNDADWLSFDAAGDLLVADVGNNRIRAISPSGTITTVAGSGTAGYSGDAGAAVSAQLNQPHSVTGLAGGGFLIGDTGNNVVRKVDPSGTITTVAGTGTAGYSGDGGPARSAQLNAPVDAITDAGGDILISDCNNNVVRAVDPTGKISTIAGTGTGGFAGDGGPATSAEFSCPKGLLSTAGDLFVADSGNGAVRSIEPNGTITTIVGQGVGTNFNSVTELWLGSAGTMYVADPGDDEYGVVNLDLLDAVGSAPTLVGSGAHFSYTFGVLNPGTVGTATGVTLTDPLPAGVTFVSGTAGQNSCTAVSGTVSCPLGPLAAGAVDAVTITVTAPSGVTDLRNTATVSADETDPDLLDNSASVVNHVGKVDVSITQTASTNVATVGQPLTFSMTIGSRGPATGVTMKDALPASLHYVSAKASQGSCSAAGGTVTCALGAIADGGSAQVTLTVTGVTAGPVTNSATVSADQSDIDLTNNSASASTIINGSTCGEVITSTTKLTADVGPCLSDGVIIGADGITLNLNGHSIIGSGTQTDDLAGVRLPFRNSVTVENGSISGFAAGIFINSGGGHTITNMNIHDNLGPAAFSTADFGDGIFIQYSSANRILNNQIIHNGHFDGVGLYGLDTNFNLIQGNTISKTTDEGVRLYGDGISLDSFNFYGEPRRGESIYGNNIIGNTIDDNSAAGISSVSNVNAQYLNNDIERNGLGNNQHFVYPDNGIGLQANANATQTTNDLVQGNKVLGNGGDGIEADLTSGNHILKNTTNGSGTNTTLRGTSDLDDFSGNCASNVWSGNTYGTGGVSPACLANTNAKVAAATTDQASAQQPAAPKNVPHRKLMGTTFRGPTGKDVGPAAAPPAPAGTVTATPACGSLITASVTLTADIGPCTGNGLIIGADNITVNLGGHSITGSNAKDGTSAGITLHAHDGVTITNGSVSGFSAGVAINMGVNDTVRGLNVHDNIGPALDGAVLSDGIAIFHSFGTQVLGNTVTHNGTHSGIGVYGADSNATTIKGNTVTASAGGTNEPLAGVGVYVTALLEPDDVRRGIPVDGNNVLQNTITGNQGGGIVSVTNISASIQGNIVLNNGVSTTGSPRDGIQLNYDVVGGASPRTTDTVLGNTVSGSGDNGIAVYSGGNLIRGSSATGDNVNNDGSVDLFDSHPGCDHNTWQGNTAGSAGASPSCA